MDKMDNVRVDRNVLGQAWLDHVNFPWDEYGVAIRNLRLGLKAPLTGSYDNYFINGMGAAIRSELWACLAPGNPVLAAKYAYEDACVDHAEEGVWAPVFLAALESQAFVESDPETLLDLALAQLPETSLVRQAVADTCQWCKQDDDWLAVRKKILNKYGHENFTDVTMNMAFIVLAWLASEDDFSKAICIATNCGKDTDCTAATVGALMGILHPEGIDEKWLRPIGNDLVVSPEIVGIEPPDTLDGFTDLVISLRERLNGKIPETVSLDQSLCAYRINADVTFVSLDILEQLKRSDVIQFPDKFQQIELLGASASLPSIDFKDDVLLLRYSFQLKSKRDVRLVFNTPQKCCVWIDGKQCLVRDGGRMAPSPHRAPHDQFADLSLEKDEHQLIAAVERPHDVDSSEWVVILADAQTMQWLPDAFLDMPI
jgi:ADP-ribosylglycohydrolase